MADITVRLDSLRVDTVDDTGLMTLPAAEDLVAGDAVRIVPSGTGVGRWTKANATTTTENTMYGVVWKDCKAGGSATAFRKAEIDGYDLSSLNFWAPVYLSDTDGKLSTTAGTTSVRVGRVVPVHSQYLGDAPNKLLLLDIPV